MKIQREIDAKKGKATKQKRDLIKKEKGWALESKSNPKSAVFFRVQDSPTFFSC
jgi:hypothetical protein